MNGPVALALLQIYNGCAAYRVVWPFDELRRQGYLVAYGPNDDPTTSAQIQYANVVILHRMSWLPGDEPKARAWRDLLHASGKALIFDCDDDLYSPPILQRVRRTGDAELNARSDEQLEVERQARIFALQLCDGVTTSTEPLAAVCRQYTDKPVLVVPNALDLPRFQAALSQAERTVPGLSIGWIGGNRPDSDAVELAEAWRRIAERYPDVRFVVAGYPLQALIQSVPADRLHVLPWLSLSRYPESYAQIDIGCCTLADESFNRSKSPIKAMELAAAGAAVVASPTVYGGFLMDGGDGLIAATADEWEAAFSVLIKDDALRGALAGSLRERVEHSHTLQANVWNWPTAWAAIWQDFQERSFRPEMVAYA